MVSARQSEGPRGCDAAVTPTPTPTPRSGEEAQWSALRGGPRGWGLGGVGFFTSRWVLTSGGGRGPSPRR